MRNTFYEFVEIHLLVSSFPELPSILVNQSWEKDGLLYVREEAEGAGGGGDEGAGGQVSKFA